MSGEEQKQSFDKYVSKKITALQTSERTYVEDNNILYYSSKHGNENNFNGQTLDKFGNKIECRALAGYVVKKGLKDYHKELSSSESIAAVDYLKNNEYDNNGIFFNGRQYYLFDVKHLNFYLHEIINTMKMGDEKAFIFASAVHAMAIAVKLKKDCIIIKFYDPNITSMHKRIVINNVLHIERLNINHFIRMDAIDHYLITTAPVVLVGHHEDNDLIVTTNVFDREKLLKLIFNLGFHKRLEKFLNENNNFSKDELLSSLNNTPQLHASCLENHYKTIDVYLKYVINCSLTIKDKYYLFSAIDDYNAPALYTAYENGNQHSVEVFIKNILVSHFSHKQKYNLILAKDRFLQSGLMIALYKRKYELIAVALHLVTSADEIRLAKSYKQQFINELVHHLSQYRNLDIFASTKELVKYAWQYKNLPMVTMLLESCRSELRLWEAIKQAIYIQVASPGTEGRFRYIEFFQSAIDLPRYTGIWGTLFNKEKTATRERIDQLEFDDPSKSALGYLS